MISVMLVDDQAMVRAGLRVILETDPDLRVVGEAADGIAAAREYLALRPEVILMDLRMPGMDGVRTTRRIRELAGPEWPRIIVLTTFDEDAHVIAALMAGANGFLSKSVDPLKLTGSIKDTFHGGGALTAAATAALIRHMVAEAAPAVDQDMKSLFATLTKREADVVKELAWGLSYEEIAEKYCISPITVKGHANRAMAKVGSRDRGQLVAFAWRAGLRFD
ncbi:MAG: response regulator transcription factor [Propionibacteriaceae bacterium]|jgi:DNA-binding NarL/FixJ family response regulator|nr:response regulator transcription factor [Propionibacteriaceae bacterium]